MRLIDADALKERIMDINSWYLYNEWWSITEFHKLIDDAPTVEQEPLVQVSEIRYSDRVKGEWRPYQFIHKAWKECSECEYVTSIETNFCPNCGADMRGTNE